ncbi:RNA-directed DNA polymerase, eukaryota, reverse transcriptase zinc-binding domain protein [Tanacetum coccineum]
MFKVVKDLKTLKKPLKSLAWKNGDLFENVKDLRDRLKEVQAKIDEDPSNKMLREEESNILSNYNVAMRDKEHLLFQKAKIKWLSVGDKNNAYFHRVLKSRNHRNRVNVIHDDVGRRYEGDQVAAQFVKHFPELLGEVSADEIKQDLFQIDDNKAPGPDGFSTHFYKKYWDIIGEDICIAVKECFAIEKMLKEINFTNIALVPKIQTPTKVSDYRPITCCNVIFKCISKVINERIKECLGNLVSQNQSAFIPNRQIQDNILISQGLLNGYDRKDRPKRVALKIDLQKAYDTINWNFLEDTLRGFGFRDKMVLWIMKCVTTTSFSVIVNGESQGYFKGGRVLRQGDPMSPYLFTLIMEVLNLLLIRRIENNSAFQYHFGGRKLKITHICFVDDLLMFGHGDKFSVKLLKDTIKEFRQISWLLLNYNKSTIIFWSVKDNEREEILEIVPFRVEKLPVRYLRLPLITKRIGVKECKSLIDKVFILSLLGCFDYFQWEIILIPYEKNMKFVELSIGPAPDTETADPDTIDKYYESVNLEQEVACFLLVGFVVPTGLLTVSAASVDRYRTTHIIDATKVEVAGCDLANSYMREVDVIWHLDVSLYYIFQANFKSEIHVMDSTHAMLKLYKKGIPKKAETPAVLAIREGKDPEGQKKPSMRKKDKKKSQGAKGKGKGKNKLTYAPKPKIPPAPKRDNPAKVSICHHCMEVGHWRRNCSSYHAELKTRKNARVASTSGT